MKNNINYTILFNKFIELQYDNKKDLNYFKSKIDENVGKMDFKTNVKGKMTSWFCFVDDEKFKTFFNLIDEPIKKLLKILNTKYKNYYLFEAWGNLLSNNNYVQVHNHRRGNETQPIISGCMYFDSNKPGTFFCSENYEIKPKLGKVILFSSLEDHYADLLQTNKKRYTLSFNINTK